MRALEKVADKALQLGESALCNYRCHSSSQCKNAALLHYAVSTSHPESADLAVKCPVLKRQPSSCTVL